MKSFFLSWYGNIILLAVVGLSVYFTNVEVQSYFGRQALAQTGLQRFTLDEAIIKASSENKQILVDVSAIWCSTCRRLDREMFANENVKKAINEKFVFSRLEYESSEGTAFLEKHNASGFPNLWILDSKGSAVRQLRVTFNEGEFIRQLQ